MIAQAVGIDDSAAIKSLQDVSVIGFDDIPSAEFQNPLLTTVRQPLQKMGEIAAAALLSRITQNPKKLHSVIYVDPELVVRETTAPVSF